MNTTHSKALLLAGAAVATGITLLLTQPWPSAPALDHSGESAESIVNAGARTPNATAPDFAGRSTSEADSSTIETPVTESETRHDVGPLQGTTSSEGTAVASDDEAEALRTAHFTAAAAAAATKSQGPVSLVVFRTEGGERVATLPWKNAGVTAQVPAFGVSACLLVASAGHGPSSVIPNGLDPCDVAVQMPELCSARLQIVEEENRKPIAGASVRLEELDGAHESSVLTTVKKLTDANGQVLIPELARGSWQMTVQLEGFEERLRWLELTAAPGEEQDWGYTGVSRYKPLPVRLVGAPADETFEGFTAELNHSDVTVGFDQDGLGVLQVGWNPGPLEVIVKYPDGRHKFSSFHDIKPGSGVEAKVQVVSDRTLEVRLRYLDDAAEVIGDSKCWLRVASKTDGSDTFQSGRAVYGEGDYVFPDLTKSNVEVSFATHFGDWPVEWASTAAVLKEGETTVVTLEVKEAPKTIQFLEATDVPLSDFSFRLRRVNDRTSFQASNLTGSDGLAELMPELGSGFLLTGSALDGADRICIDAPFSFDVDAEGTPTVMIGPFVDYFLDVLVDGSPTQGIRFNFHGSINDRYDDKYFTNEHGRAGPVRYSEASRIRVYLDSDKYWWDLPSLEIEPGRNAVSLTRVGTVTASSRETLGKLRSEAQGTSVEQWVQGGKAKYAQAAGGRWSCRIPIGSYSLENGTEEPTLLQLGAQEALNL